MVRIRVLLTDSLKESAVFGAIALPLAYLLVLWIHIAFIDSLGFVLLIESCGLMLVGGAMDLTSTPAVRRFVAHVRGGKADPHFEGGRNFAAAAVYTLTGVILFAASMAVAIALGF
jgi:hypothetical protein